MSEYGLSSCHTAIATHVSAPGPRPSSGEGSGWRKIYSDSDQPYLEWVLGHAPFIHILRWAWAQCAVNVASTSCEAGFPSSGHEYAPFTDLLT